MTRGPVDAVPIEPGYMTVDQAVVYAAFPSKWALYKWVKRSGVRTYRRGSRLLFKRRDIDEALKPVEDRGTRHFFPAVKLIRRRG